MTHEIATECWRQIEATQQKDLKIALVRLAINYSAHRVQWKLVGVDARIALSPARTAAHNAFIDACNILSRSMLKAGEGNDWRNQLGQDRKEIGDFACFIVLFLGIAAR